jgi:hypothetical protein
MTEREKRELINRIEHPRKNQPRDNQKKEMYISQTDRNYKDGDRN